MQSPPFPRYLVPLRSILILSTHLHLVLPSGLLPSGFPTKTLYTPSPHPYMPHAQPISFFSILSRAQYWVRSTNHLAPRYAISSIPPLPRPVNKLTNKIKLTNNITVWHSVTSYQTAYCGLYDNFGSWTAMENISVAHFWISVVCSCFQIFFCWIYLSIHNLSDGHGNLIQNREILVVPCSEVTSAWALQLFGHFKAGKKCEQCGEAEYFVA